MSEQDYFKEALSDFTHEAASGGAIRHLADLGCTVRQIKDQLTFPTPLTRVQKITWEHLLDTEVILLKEPGTGTGREKAAYVVDQDRYGRTSFRRVQEKSDQGNDQTLFLKERVYEEKRDGGLALYLREKCMAEGGKGSYISCDFGLQSRTNPGDFEATMELLSGREREYILGLPWVRERCYHRLDQRMREIIVRLYEADRYEGICYFLGLEEKVRI